MAQRSEDVRPDDAVARILAGEQRVEVTLDGEVVALVVEPESLRGLAVRRAKVSGGFSDLPRATIDQTIQEVFDDLRAER